MWRSSSCPLWIDHSASLTVTLRTRLDAEAALSQAPCYAATSLSEHFHIDALQRRYGLSLCGVTLRSEPLLILERETYDQGACGRASLRAARRIRAHMSPPYAIADAAKVASFSFSTMFACYGEVSHCCRAQAPILIYSNGWAPSPPLRLPRETHVRARHAADFCLWQERRGYGGCMMRPKKLPQGSRGWKKFRISRR